MNKALIYKVLQNIFNVYDINKLKFENINDFLFDYTLVVNKTLFLCQVKKVIVTKANFGLILKRMLKLRKEVNEQILFITKKIDPQLMNELIKHGINCIDMYGNCRIQTKEFIIHIEGKKDNISPLLADFSKRRTLSTIELKILFYILIDKDFLNNTYRFIQNKTQVSLGSITMTMKKLEMEGFLFSIENKKFIRKKKELLERWIIGYNENLKPKLFLRRMTFRNQEVKNNWTKIKLPDNCYWGGEPAAYMEQEFLYPEIFTIYSNTELINFIRCGLKPDDNGEIFIYEKFWNFESEKNTTPILLTYADLIGSGISRNIEAANKLYSND